MSFPDSFVFDLENLRIKDAVRQMGNAVPVNLAFAQGRELLKVVVAKHCETRVKGKEELVLVFRGNGKDRQHAIVLEDSDYERADIVDFE